MTGPQHDTPLSFMPPRSAIAILALLAAVAPLAIDMYLPAFPGMADELGTSATGIQLTLTAFLIGLALGQLLIGPLSDSVGRRRPLLIGSAFCLAATIVCALAPSGGVLIAARFLQGLGGAAGVVLSRAVVADTAKGAAAARLLSVLLVITVIAPVIAPLSGGAIIAAAGWRAVFWVQAGLVLIMFVGAFLLVAETLPRSARARGGIMTSMRSARLVLANRRYTGYMLTFCMAFAAMFAYISASPFVVQGVMGLSETTFTLLFSLNAIAISITSGLAASLAGRVSYRRMVAIGLSFAGVAGLGLLVCALTGVPVVATLIMFGLLQGSLGFVFANTTALALAETGEHAGTGSAFLGAAQFGLAAVVAPLVGVAGQGSVMPMALVVVVSLALAVVAFIYAGTTDREDEHSGADDQAALLELATV